MARIQILELPVIDQADYDSLNSLSAALEGWQNVKDQIGARAVLVFEEAVGIPANEPVSRDEFRETQVDLLKAINQS